MGSYRPHEFLAYNNPALWQDHFSSDDVTSITRAFSTLVKDHKYIITTEKDAVRLKEFTNIAEPVKSSIYYIPVGIHFLNDDSKEFDNLITEYVRKNKRNNRISEG